MEPVCNVVSYGNLETITRTNTDYRLVVATGTNIQLVLMNLKPGVEVGWEVHPGNDQFIRVESGSCVVQVEDKQIFLGDGDFVLIPAGTKHNVTNTSSSPCKLYTLYAPPHHPPNTREVEKVS